MHRLSGLAVLALITSVWLVSVNAQERTRTASLEPRSASSAPVPAGTYIPFNMWQKVRFGATALMNPKAAEEAMLVYEFDADKVSGKLSSSEIDALKKMFADREVRFGESWTTGGLVVSEKGEKKALGELATCEGSCETKLKGAFVSPKAELAGVRPSRVLIVWDPVDPASEEKRPNPN